MSAGAWLAIERERAVLKQKIRLICSSGKWTFADGSFSVTIDVITAGQFALGARVLRTIREQELLAYQTQIDVLSRQSKTRGNSGKKGEDFERFAELLAEI
jgi:hypothetical protein